MTTKTTAKHKLSTQARQSDSFGWDSAEFQLDVWQDDDNNLFVRVAKDGKTYASNSFRDCETQHHDSERWLNDQIGFPNPFAGILANPEVWSE